MPTPFPITGKAKQLLKSERGAFYCTFCGYENGIPDDHYGYAEDVEECDFCGGDAKYWQSSHPMHHGRE